MTSPPGVDAIASYEEQRQRRARWFGRIWPVIWMISAMGPCSQLARDGGPGGLLRAALFMATTVVLGAVAARGLIRIRKDLPSHDRLALVLLGLGSLGALYFTSRMHETAAMLAFYVAAAGALVLPMTPALVVVSAVSAVIFLLDGRVGWPSTHWMALGMLATGAGAALGRRSSIRGNLARRMSEHARQLEINDERNRMARDLHDILGHSLTVITLKTELAARLLDADPAAARHELAEVQSLSRSALADVRATVNNYRELSLAGELARAANTLASAGVKAELPLTVDQVAPELRELFAWALREGVTNVVRHARAQHCRVQFGPGSIQVQDDGVGVTGPSDGHGITGLRERCEANGADLVLRPGPHGKGTELRVTARRLDSPLNRRDEEA